MGSRADQRRTRRARRALAFCVAALGALLLPAASASAQVQFTDWTGLDAAANVASGTLRGVPVVLSGSDLSGGGVVDGSWPGFADPAIFTPALAKSDMVEIRGFPGYAYTIDFGAPVRDPVLHVFSLGSTLAFPAGVALTKVSGEPNFTVSGSSVVGDGVHDSSGTVQIHGTFTSLTFSASPLYTPGGPDGIDLQIGSNAATGAPPPPPGGGVPAARLSVTRPFLRRALTLRHAGWLYVPVTTLDPRVAAKRIAWDFDADGVTDATCGGDAPAISHPFLRSGRQKVFVTVTDNYDRTTTRNVLVDIQRSAANKARAANRVFTCENPVGTNQPSRADCVKTFAFSIVEVNARGAADQCFAVTSRGLAYHATVAGPVAVNGLPIPLPSDQRSEYDSGDGRLGLGRVPLVVVLPGATQVRVTADLDVAVRPVGNRFTLPPIHFAQGPAFAGLRLSGALTVTLFAVKSLKGSTAETRFSDVGVSVTLPDFLADLDGRPLQGMIGLRTSNARGFQLGSLDIAVPAALFGPLVVRNLFFHYVSAGNRLQTGASFQFPGFRIDAAPPPAGRGLGLANGAFQYAGLGLDLPKPGPQVFPGVGLYHLDGTFGVDPVRLTGGVGLTAAGIVDIDGTVFGALARPGQPYTIPAGSAPPGFAFLEGRRVDSYAIGVGGTVSLDVPPLGPIPLADGHVFYSAPSLFELGGHVTVSPLPLLSVTGDVGGWLALGAGRFNLEGKVEACVGFTADLPIVGELDVRACDHVSGVVSTRGIGFCVGVSLPIVGDAEVGVGYRWGATLPGVSVFTCDFAPYREVRPASAAAARAGVRTFDLHGGLPAEQIRVTGRGRAPDVTLTGPGGETIVGPGGGDRDHVVIREPGSDAIVIALRRPAAGRYTLHTRAGSAPLAGVATADGLAMPKVSGTVTRHGARRVLRYRIRAVPGQSVTFAEQGPGSYRLIGRARGTRGRIAFTPGPGPRGGRRILALVDRAGVTRYRLPVARFAAPAPAGPAPPQALRVAHRRDGVVVSWRRARGAARYGVLLRLSTGQRVFRLTSANRIHVAAVSSRARGSASVRGLSAIGLRGRPATRRLR